MDNGSTLSVNELKQENYLLKSENNSLRIRCKAMQETIDNIREKNVRILTDLELFKFHQAPSNGSNNPDANTTNVDSNVIKRYLSEIEELR